VLTVCVLSRSSLTQNVPIFPFSLHAYQDLDEDSAAGLSRLRQNDSEIDSGVAQLSRTIDTLGNIGAAMKDEVCSFGLCLCVFFSCCFVDFLCEILQS